MADPVFRAFAETVGSDNPGGWTHNPHLAAVPAGLAVGDLIVIFACTYTGAPSSAPSGFDELEQTLGTNFGITTYTKIADADDAAADNFPIGNTGGVIMSSFTYAFQNGGSVEFTGSNRTSADDYNTVPATPFTPSMAKPVVLFCSMGATSTKPSSYLVDEDAIFYIEDGHEGEIPATVVRPDDPSGWTGGVVASFAANHSPDALTVVVLRAPVTWTGSIEIDGGASATTHPTVALALAATVDIGSVADMSFSDDGATWDTWQDYAASAAYTMESTPGAKTVYVRFRDEDGNVSPTYSDGIELVAAVWTATLVINAGAASTADNDVTLAITCVDQNGDPPDQMRLAEDAADADPGSVVWGAWEAYATTKAWQLAAQTDEDPHARGVGVEFRHT